MPVFAHFFTLIFAEAAGGAGTSGAPGPSGGEALMQMLLMFVPLMIVFWLFFIRPESKRRREKEALLSAVKAKDKVVTIGGMHGTVVDVDGEEIVLLVDPKKDIKLRFRRSAIDTVGQVDEKEKK